MPKKELPKEASAEVREATERVLEAKFGQRIEIDSGKPLTKAIFRFQVLNGSDDMPLSVVAKQKTGDRHRFVFNEWAGLQLLTECCDGLEPAPMPRFYGGDVDHRLIVIEDLENEDRLEEIIMGDDPVLAHRGLVDFAHSLGVIQGCTVGKRERFEAIYQAIGHGMALTPANRRDYWFKVPPDYESEMHDSLHEHYVDMFLELCRYIDVTPHPDTRRELESIQTYLTDPEHSFLTLTHEDIYGVNVQYHGQDMKIFDFEWCQYRHALSDGIKCWTALDGWTNQWAVPKSIEEEMEQVYRAALSKGCPQAQDDDVFYREVVQAVVMETVLGIYRRQSPERLFELKERSEQDQKVYDSRCQRLIHRCRLLSEWTEKMGYLEAIGETGRRIEDKCHTFWPDHVFEIPLFPAFRQMKES